MSAYGLWAWAEAVYARPGVEAALLDLQDQHGQNVPLLLWAAWAGATDPDLVGEACAAARRWEQTVVGQLRLARRALKASAAPVAEAGRERLRQQVKAAELAAERLLLEGLEMLTPARGRAAPLEALTAARVAWGGAADAPLRRLARLIEPQEAGQ